MRYFRNRRGRWMVKTPGRGVRFAKKPKGLYRDRSGNLRDARLGGKSVSERAARANLKPGERIPKRIAVKLDTGPLWRRIKRELELATGGTWRSRKAKSDFGWPVSQAFDADEGAPYDAVSSALRAIGKSKEARKLDRTVTGCKLDVRVYDPVVGDFIGDNERHQTGHASSVSLAFAQASTYTAELHERYEDSLVWSLGVKLI